MLNDLFLVWFFQYLDIFLILNFPHDGLFVTIFFEEIMLGDWMAVDFLGREGGF